MHSNGMLLKNALQGLQGISSLACIATRFSATYTAKPSDIQIVKCGLHVLHEIGNFYFITKLISPDSRTRIREATQPYL